MNVLLISDIHSNFDALSAVVRDARSRFVFSETWVLGDLVGYGPDPNECLAMLAEMNSFAVAGNHDLAVTGKISTDRFNPLAEAAVRWTQDALDARSLEMLNDLPDRLERHNVALVHGSPRDPVWEYITEEIGAGEALEMVGTSGLVTGHTHFQAIFERQSGMTERVSVTVDSSYVLGGSKFLVNPGSVGQPRDRDPRANYAVLDLEDSKITFCRVDYDFEATAHKIYVAGLPSFLADRLSQGR